MNAEGYFDLQINGYAGVDFNQDDLTGEDLLLACERLVTDGVSGVLATIITDSLPAMQSRIQRLVKLREAHSLIEQMICGIHIEGPFISAVPGFVGAHPRDQAREGVWDEMAQLLDAADGLAWLVTLAPEQDPHQELTRKLARKGIVVAAGHTDASMEQLNACIDQGLSLFTHLGNGCPMQMHRHDNIIQRALSRCDALHYSFIADGAHVPFFALKNYLRLAGIDRSIIVSDAIAAAGCGPGRYQLGDRMVTVGEDGVPRASDHSHLVGSGTIMKRMALNLAEHLALTEAEIDQMLRVNPRRLISNTTEAPQSMQPLPA